MLIRNLFALLTLLIFVSCSSTDSKPISEETQAKVDKAQVKTRLELVIELGVLIEESKLSASDKAYLMERYKNAVKEMAMGIAEQNKVASAMINNLALNNNEGMRTKKDLQRRFEQLEKQNSKRKFALLKELSNSLQGKVSQDKIDEINESLSKRGFVIIETIQK